jgi:ribonucleoside-diphosphate reductase alpha chain
MVGEHGLDYKLLGETVAMGVRFLDDMITVNDLPFKKLDNTTKAMRSIGLGTMGLADLLYKLGISYGSPQCMDFIHELYLKIRNVATKTSQQLAEERGCYDFWEGSTWCNKGILIRNSNLLSIAPNGSIAFIANTSGGLEPNFALCYTRRMNDGTTFQVVNPIFKMVLESRGLYSDKVVQDVLDNNGSCQGIPGIPDDIQKVFVVASDVTPQQHLDVLAIIQENVDLSCSKTINLPHETPIEDVSNIYIRAWKAKVKGITIYRDGSRNLQTLSTAQNEPLNHRDQSKIQFDTVDPIEKDDFGETYGINTKCRVACGKLYVNPCKDKNGNLVELFANVGKGGVCASNVNGISRLVSLALDAGVKVDKIVAQLSGIICPACTAATANGQKLSGRSCSDVIAKMLSRAYESDEILVRKTSRVTSPKKSLLLLSEGDKSKCPKCEGNLSFEGGCNVCHSCGYSKCG